MDSIRSQWQSVARRYCTLHTACVQLLGLMQEGHDAIDAIDGARSCAQSMVAEQVLDHMPPTAALATGLLTEALSNTERMLDEAHRCLQRIADKEVALPSAQQIVKQQAVGFIVRAATEALNGVGIATRMVV